MRSLRDVMDVVATSETALDHYGELAPVYDFVTARRYDHDAMATFVERHAAGDVRTVLVGGCGPGRLLARLAGRYDDVVGVDASAAMVSRARDRVGEDAIVVEGDLFEYAASERFDVVTVLGNTLGHVPLGDLSDFFGRIGGALTPGGVFSCDFMQDATLANGYVRSDAFESDRYRVDRTVVTTVAAAADDPLGRTGRFSYAYELTDTHEEDTVRTGTSTTVRAFDPTAVLGIAISVGFTEAAIVDPPTPHGAGLVARWPGPAKT